MNEPLILWNEVDRFLGLLERSRDVHALVFPPKKGPGSDKRAKKLLLDEQGRQGAELLLAMPLYKHHALGVRPNPGGTKATDITSGVALFMEADGGLSLEEQEDIPRRLGMPQPTFTIWTGNKSLHLYWCATDDGKLSPDQWRQGQKRLIAAVRAVVPEAGVDEAIHDPSRVMRAPGGIHPATGERCRIHSESGERYNLTALVEMLPPLEQKKQAPRKKSSTTTDDDISKAETVLAFLPPQDFQRYDAWLRVGMALHAVSDGLIHAWTDWSRPMDTFDEEEILQKWQSFSSDRSEGLGLGSLIHWAIPYGYKPPRSAPPTVPSAPPLPSWSQLISFTLEAVRKGDIDKEMELRAEISGRFRRNDAQVDAALFRLLTEQEAGPKKEALFDSVDLSAVEGLDYLVDGFLPANGLALSYGPKGVGKTTAAVALSFSVIDGKGFLDHSKRSQPGKVLFIASDSGAGSLRTVLQNMGMGDHPAIRPGADQQFFVWAHEAEQGHTAWDVSVRGCVRLLQFVKEKGISLVVIDSAKAVCAKAGLSYVDNDAVNALLTFMKEAVTPHCSVLFLSHDGTSVGSHAGAKAWAEIVDVVHRQNKPEGDHHSRQWTVVKNRLGPTREFFYALEEGELVLSAGVETIGDASSAVLKVLREAHANGKDKLSRKGLHEELLKRFDYAPKTIDNTLQRLVQGKAPEVVRRGKGFYALSPKALYRGCLLGGEESLQTPVIPMEEPTTQALPKGNSSGNGGRSEDWHALPKGEGLGNGRVMPSTQSYQGEMPDSSPAGGDTPLEEPAFNPFDSVEVFGGSFWSNGWEVAAVEGEWICLMGAGGAERRVRAGLVRHCQAA